MRSARLVPPTIEAQWDSYFGEARFDSLRCLLVVESRALNGREGANRSSSLPLICTGLVILFHDGLRRPEFHQNYLPHSDHEHVVRTCTDNPAVGGDQ